MSTDCYAVVFEGGDEVICPVSYFALNHLLGRWRVFHVERGEMYPISQVWHCPSPVGAAELLRNLDRYAGYAVGETGGSTGVTLICRNPAPKEKP